MPEYLTQFSKKLKLYEGSLVSVKSVKGIEPNAKEYLNKLSKEGSIERVKWGWYWVTAEVKDVWDFLEKDQNFKVVSAQTAASFWNNDFVHRDVYVLKVNDKSYGKALKEFGKKKVGILRLNIQRTPPKSSIKKSETCLSRTLKKT